MIRLPSHRIVLPNLFTLAATFCGFAVIWMAQQATTPREFYLAATLVPLACLLDGFDGRVARLVQGESKFGVQMDSLSDFLTFGVAPAMLVYFWALQGLGFWGMVCAFAFAAAAMIRLARFNVMAEEDGGKAPYFTGLPAPMAGLSLAVVVALDTGLLRREAVMADALPAIVAFVLIMAFLMVSEVPFRTFKDVRMTPALRLVVAGVLGSIIAVSVVADFMVALSIALFGYVLGGIAGSVRMRRRRIGLAHEEERLVEEELEELLEEELSLFVEEDEEVASTARDSG